MKTLFSILLLCSFVLSFGQSFDGSFKNIEKNVKYDNNSVLVTFDSPINFNYINQSEDFNLVVFGYLLDNNDTTSFDIEAFTFSTFTHFENVPKNVIWISSVSKDFTISMVYENIAIK